MSPCAGRGRRTCRGSAALDELRRAATTLGVRTLHVEVGSGNDRARRVYARSGLEESGRLLLTLPLAAPAHEA